jgi:chromosome partitioning protein
MTHLHSNPSPSSEKYAQLSERQPMDTWAVVARKGGVGKTSTTVNLAAAMAAQGYRPLVIDLDSQASATSWLGGPECCKGLFDFLVGDGNVAGVTQGLEELVVPAKGGVDLIPGSEWLASAEKLLAAEPGAELLLRLAVQRLPNRWDVILLDTPPGLGLLTVSALAAARWVLLPVELHALSVRGLIQVLQTIKKVQERMNPSLCLGGILPSRVNLRTRHGQEILDMLRTRFPGQVFETVIRENIRLAEAPGFQEPILSYDAKCHGAEDFRRLEIEFRVRRKSMTKAAGLPH